MSVSCPPAMDFPTLALMMLHALHIPSYATRGSLSQVIEDRVPAPRPCFRAQDSLPLAFSRDSWYYDLPLAPLPFRQQG